MTEISMPVLCHVKENRRQSEKQIKKINMVFSILLYHLFQFSVKGKMFNLRCFLKRVVAIFMLPSCHMLKPSDVQIQFSLKGFRVV